MTATSDPQPSRRPRPAPREPFQEIAVARRHPDWGMATLGLLATGLTVGYVSLGLVATGVLQRCAAAGPQVCNERTHALMLGLPVVATVLSLVISMLGGRLLARTGRSPMIAARAAWGLFVVVVLVVLGYEVAGGQL
ncbi:MAG: hypothetical protein ACT4O0_16100 [Pseudonocardia sp.]